MPVLDTLSKAILSISNKVDKIYPVDSVYISISSQNSSKIFGGVWERFAEGRTLVGVDLIDSDLNESKKSGGSVNPLSKHLHVITGNTYRLLPSNGSGSSNTLARSTDVGDEKKGDVGISAADSGNSSNHKNWQPYMTVYMWIRTA